MNAKDKEYDILRKEIEFYLSKINLMTNVLYVSVTAIIAWAIESQNSAICGLTYCIIIPSYVIVQSYNYGILKIGAYLNVFFDDYKWEQRLHKFNLNTKGKILRLTISYKLPYIFTGVLSASSSNIIFASNPSNNSILYCIGYSIVTIIGAIFLLTRKSSDAVKQTNINEWVKIKESENSDNAINL